MASHGLRFLTGDRDPLPLLAGVLSGDGVGTAVEEAVVSPVAEGVELATESLRFSPAPAEEAFKSDVTFIVAESPPARLPT